MRYHEHLYKNEWLMAYSRVRDLEDVQKGLLARPQRAKGGGLLFLFVEPRSDARTPLETIFIILTRKGATGFDGDTEVSGACRALGVS